tara:strand:- start:669 stop:1952 length:1284 start_codon:yes stop_codon:yes gene_type:complete
MACPNLSTLGRVRITAEAEADFATDLTGSATYYDLPVMEGIELSLDQEEIEVPVIQQLIDGYAETVPGPRTATLSIEVPLYGTGIVADDGNPSAAETDAALLLLLSLIYGGIDDANAGSDVASAADPHLVMPTSATGFAKGGVVGRIESVSGRYQARAIADVDAGELHLKSNFVDADGVAEAPTVAQGLYAGTTIYPVNCSSRTIQMEVWKSDGAFDHWLLMGGQIEQAPTITRELGQVPRLGVTITFAAYKALASEALAPATYPNYQPIIVEGHLSLKLCGLNVAGTEQADYTDQCIDASSVSYTLNSPVYQRIMSACAGNVIGGWRRSRAVPFAEVEITVPMDDLSYFTSRDARERWYIQDQIGTAPGETWFIETPCAQLTNVAHADAEGLAYQTLTFRAGADDGIIDPDTTDEQQIASMRLHHL